MEYSPDEVGPCDRVAAGVPVGEAMLKKLVGRSPRVVTTKWSP
jgi:hypothetical protein